MKNTMRKLAALVLAFVMMFGFAQGTLSAEAAGFCDHKWENNLITDDPFKAFGLERDEISSVTFLDSMEYVPYNAWNMGKGASSRVKGWMEWNGGLADVYFAADGGINGENCTEGLFRDMTELVEVTFNGAFHTEYATSMAQMFYGCANLETVDVETLNTANVTSMYEMFRDCMSLESLDVSTWDTSNVKSMYCMFSTCTSLEELDLSSFDTAKVTNMGFLFSACKSLKNVYAGGWNTRKVTNMEGMFRWCDSLESLDWNGWDLSRVKTYSNFMDPGVRIGCIPWECYFK